MNQDSQQNPSAGIDLTTVLAASLHEIKNDLALMTNRLDGLSMEFNDKPQIRTQFLEINHNTNKISSELMRLLALYKLDKSKLLPKLEQIPIDEFLEDKVLKFEELCQHRDLSISFECDSSLSGYFDTDLINSVIDTAIHNALRFTKSRLLLSAETLDIKQDNSETALTFLCIRVEDDGEGFPKEAIDQDNLETSHDFEEGSTGLGLYFAKQIANVHARKNLHGFIKLSNQHSLPGACFSLYLP